MPIAEFLVGFYQTALTPDEVVTRRRRSGPAAAAGSAYLKYTSRSARGPALRRGRRGRARRPRRHVPGPAGGGRRRLRPAPAAGRRRGGRRGRPLDDAAVEAVAQAYADAWTRSPTSADRPGTAGRWCGSGCAGPCTPPGRRRRRARTTSEKERCSDRRRGASGSRPRRTRRSAGVVDIPFVGACLPGAREVGPDGPGTYRGRFGIKVGPVSVSLRAPSRSWSRTRRPVPRCCGCRAVTAGSAARSSARCHRGGGELRERSPGSTCTPT